MKNIFQLSLVVLGFLLISTVSFSQDQCAPVGWATQNGGTTGGGAAAPITVSTLADLKTQAGSSGAKVIYVSGIVGTGVSTRVSVAANKTIIGLPGATLYGGFDVKTSNIIIRNMIIHGPGSVDVNGVDCITIDGSSTTNVWIDHCDIYDGQDGNMDIVNGANYIAVTWCKFHYTSASTNHQFCNLLGNSDSKTSDRGKLKITMMYNWWTAGCVERMPRVRFGQVHVVNNLFDSKQTSYCVRAGIEANILVESNYFDAIKNPIDLYQNNFTAVTEKNNFFNNTTGTKAGSGTAFTPPYSLSITPAANVKALVSAGAGATMSSPTSCGGAPTTYTLTTTSSPSAGGTVSGAGTYASGTVVTVTATPAAGYTFTGWSGAAGGTSISTTVTMNANKAVTATFAPNTYTLNTAANPVAGGSVTGAGTYNSGAVVTITASPAAGYIFTGWSGDASGTSTSTTVTMSANRSVTANFQPISGTTYTLATTASPVAGGTVTGAGTYNSGTVVTVTAIPSAGYAFTGWSGDASGTATSTTITMNSNKSVTANFQLITYTLSTVASPAAGGTVTGAGTYNSGTVVTVTATPAAGYTFTGWSGAASGTNASTTVTMNSNKSVTANFKLITYTLTTAANPAAGGSVTGAGTYNPGTVVTVTATPAAGYTFTSWSGDASGTSTSTTVTMSANRSVTANFQASGGGGTTTIRIEDDATAATGLCLYEGSVSSNSGANNGKVINLTNSVAKGVNWRVNVAAAGSYTLNWRYTNGSTSNTYTMKFIVNGVTINAALPFPKTSGSSVFANTTATVAFIAGNNDIRLESVASNATADIDWIEITGNNPAPGNCAAARPAPITNKVDILTSSKNPGVFPNPAKGKTSIGFYLSQNDKVTIKVYDSYGRMIDDLGTRQFVRGDQQVGYNLMGKKPGFYNIMVTGQKGSKKVLKLIVE